MNNSEQEKQNHYIISIINDGLFKNKHFKKKLKSEIREVLYELFKDKKRHKEFQEYYRIIEKDIEKSIKWRVDNRRGLYFG